MGQGILPLPKTKEGLENEKQTNIHSPIDIRINADLLIIQLILAKFIL